MSLVTFMFKAYSKSLCAIDVRLRGREMSRKSINELVSWANSPWSKGCV